MEVELCKRCREKNGIIGYDRDCRNCEGWKSCLHWLWFGNEPKDTIERAETCSHFALMGSHRTITCARGV